MNLRSAALCLGILLATAAAVVAEPVVDPLNDTSVYPIAVWAMDSRTAPAFAEMGVNIFVAGEGGNPKAWADELAKNKCVGFVNWQGRSDDVRKAVASSPGFLGWMHGDEPDNPGVDAKGEFHATMTMPEVLIARYEEMKKSAVAAPMYLNLGIGLAVGASQSTPDPLYYEFMKCADVVCYDVYPVSTHPDGENRLHLVARGVERLRRFAGPDKPVWIWLECTRLNGNASDIGNRAPLPHELRAEVWMSILYGASGIGYFPHQFTPYKGGPSAIPDDIKAEMKLTNRLLHAAAPILRTGKPSRLQVDAESGQVTCGAWQTGDTLLVAAVNMRNEPAKVTIHLPESAKELNVVGQNYKVKPSGGLLAQEFKPYEVRLYTTGSAVTYQHYGYPAPSAAAAAGRPEDVAIDFEEGLPKGATNKGDAKLTAERVHGGKQALALSEMSDVTIPLSEKDARGKVTMWVYDSSVRDQREDENKPANGPVWGLQNSQGKMVLFGIIRRSFLSQNSYSFIYADRVRGYPSPGFCNSDRTKDGWYKWEFDLTTPGEIHVRVNDKEIDAGTADAFASFAEGFNAIKLVGGDKDDPESIVVDDIQVTYPAPAEEKPGLLADVPFARDNRKGVLWSRTPCSRVAVPELATAPAIDGDYSEEAWGGGETLASWSTVDGKSIPTYETLGVVGHKDGKLYLAFRATEDFMDDLVTDKKAGWQNDCIEIFFDPDNRRTSFCHIVITAAGNVEASRLVQDAWGEGLRDDAWKPTITAKTGRWSRGWTIEVAIDLKDIGDMDANSVWAFDVCRERKPEPAENSVYTQGGFTDGFTFGEMTFEPADVTLANGTLTNRTDSPVEAQVEILISTPAPGDWFADWEARWFDLARETVTMKLEPHEQVRLINRELTLKMPAGGRLRLTLKKPGPALMEEFIANVWGAVEKK
ncbi:MAG: hypothetical protein JXL80_02335 [Planctomycetes bacterium]|nr:hypothetical protein [Planctomycetota bacterium]